MTMFDFAPQSVGRAMRGLLPDDAVDEADAVRRYALAIWSALAEPGDSVASQLISALGPEAAVRYVESAQGDARGIAVVGEINPGDLAKALKRWSLRLEPRAVATSLEAARRAKTRLVVPGDREWPDQLDDLGPHAPLCLWVRGVRGALARLDPSVALVGARAATGYGTHVAAELAAELAGNGIPIVSGAAYGIDGAAHRAALAAGGLTVALLAGGCDRPYPTGHTQLIDDIARAGALVSEVPCGSAPTKWRFLQRNRLIAALSTATVVVEAGWRSGSLNTAGHASTLGRQLGAVPGPVTSAASVGCHRLLREFDAECITSAADALELLGLHVPGTSPARHPHPGDGGDRRRTDDQTRILDALSSRTWRDVDEIARRCGMGRREAESVLGLLQLQGEAERSARGWRHVTAARSPAAHR